MASVSAFTQWRRRRAASLTDQLLSQRQDPEGAAESSHGNGGIPSGSALAPPPSSHHLISSSVGSFHGHDEPVRSFVPRHGLFQDDSLAPFDSTQNALSIRRDTAELASYLLSDGSQQQRPAFLSRPVVALPEAPAGDEASDEGSLAYDNEPDRSRYHQTILEVSEPPSPDEAVDVRVDDEAQEAREAREAREADGPSILSNLLKKSSSQTLRKAGSSAASVTGKTTPEAAETSDQGLRSRNQHGRGERGGLGALSEQTPLLRRDQRAGARRRSDEAAVDLEGQNVGNGGRTKMEQSLFQAFKTASMPLCCGWDRSTIWQKAVVNPVSCSPAVAVGLLLNILDALSYGMILFPLGTPIFSHLGSAGISIYYVSTIIAQLTFSTGSIFKGAVGSELIEVVPFFHNMAARILAIVGEEKPDAVIATTIVAYALSSMMTGLVFYLMGRFRFGYMVGFIPRHILIGCIGGVGWFLVATGFQVSARLHGNLEYNLETLRQLVQPSVILLWAIPLVLAVVLFYAQSRSPSKYFLPLFILSIPLVFYFFVLSLDTLDPSQLRDDGWIFAGPPPDEPWWYFYTLYKFHLVHWGAIVEVIPAMLALTFFGILHVPINVPALALNSGEDHADLDKELKLHGYSNFISGCFGSIQNYLVYANTVFFLRSGGNKRLAGYMLALLTLFVMMIGPSLISWIPVMMVGTLIFDLGFELLTEALWLPRKKLKPAEYATVVVIVLVMGIHDFVVGIGIGILLAFVSLVIQTSQVSPIGATYSGNIVGSTVRRNPAQDRYLHQVGRQIHIIKLTGYLFFGTVGSVETSIRGLLADRAFSQRRIKFLILDLRRVTGLDYSAGEAFNTISRLLHTKGVHLILCGLNDDCELGKNLRAVGLGRGPIEVMMLPDLNSALESCENELLKTLYAHQEALNAMAMTAASSTSANANAKRPATESLDIPAATHPSSGRPLSDLNPPFESPRQNDLAEAACQALSTADMGRRVRWQIFNEPLRLMLQIFQSLSDKNEDFWFPAAPYFVRKEYIAGTTLFRVGEAAEGFYLVEKGILRAEYDLPQGWLCESIVAGTTCGELPFFSETERTATVQVEKDCVVWVMDREAWRRLQEEEGKVAGELLRISLKLTSERMSTITSYILTTAG